MAAMNASPAARLPDVRITPGSGAPLGSGRVDAAGREQLIAGAQDQHRLAVPVLILDELERPAIGAQGMDGVRAVWQHQGVVEDGWRRLQADVHFDGLAGSGLHRTERRRHEARHRTFTRQPIGEGREGLTVTSICHEDRHPAGSNAAVPGSGR